MILRFYHCALLAILSLCLLVSIAGAGGLILYELGTPDLGTAGADRAAMAADASMAALNPAGMTRLNRSQKLAAFQELYVNARFDTGTASFGGGDGGKAGGFVSAGSVHYVHSIKPDWKFGISAGYYFGFRYPTLTDALLMLGDTFHS